ncbi:hypothetical protein HOG16_03545 [Candidatus Woesearchaeota archaeon]|jgi:hypothetical protein|nr:hypothetical protein [Candidatus Woesearchaeota archaeon]MBT4321599.1 hypothetical protein [Candidatus Woesearchaeota archaeon]MBT4631090.1 hypothetical protein [Candidatus Woesearchaeota archaeon]
MAEENEQMSLGKDLAFTVPFTLGGLFVGACCAFVYPIGFPKNIVEESRGGINEINHVALNGTATLGYLLGVGAGIVYPIVNNPENPASYIGAGISTLSGLVYGIYQKGRSDEREAVSIEEDNKLEKEICES